VSIMCTEGSVCTGLHLFYLISVLLCARASVLPDGSADVFLTAGADTD